MTELELLRQWVRESRRMVFLGGAGVSTASGIPDFRSAHGLYQQKKAGLSYEEMLSHRYFVHHTAEFYDFLRGVMLYPDAKPNGAHYALARLEREGRLRAVITQNIDGLHQMAGSQNVLELHGSENRYTCLSCGKKYDMSCVTQSTGVPKCSCGGTWWRSWRPLEESETKKGGQPGLPSLLLWLFVSFFSLFDALRQQILDLPVDGAEIVLGPLGQVLPQFGRDAQQDLLFSLFL